MNITFKIIPIPYYIEKKCFDRLMNEKHPYQKCSKKIIDSLITQYPILTEYIIQSIKSAHILNQYISMYPSLLHKKEKISIDYNKNGLLYSSYKYKTSPLLLFNVALQGRGMDKKQILHLINNDELNEYDKKQYEIGKTYDDYSIRNEKEILKLSLSFELEIEKILIKNKILYETQESLTRKQKKEGLVHSTPDFLIISKLIVNNEEIKWIDAKNFYGANTFFIKSKIKKQTQKYIKNYGKGMIIFKEGISEKLQFNNICLTDIQTFQQSFL